MKVFGFRSRKRIFLFVLPILLLFGGLRVNLGAFEVLRAELSYESAIYKLPDFSQLTYFLRRFHSTTPAAGYSLEITSLHAGAVERYGLLQLALATDVPFTNPYDSESIDLKVLFISPSGKQFVVGAFWYQDFDPSTRRELGKAGWRVRFTPAETGQWTAKAIAPAFNLESEQYEFTVAPSQLAGFVRINPSNAHYLATSDGNFFFPIGVNMAWWEEGKDPLGQYRSWLDQFSKNGGNTIRVWMAAWSFGIEWKDCELGNYSNRQYEAWLLDQLFQLADEHHVKIILVLMNHGALSLTANSEWKDNPYNDALGGPISSPEQFVTDPSAIAFFQQRLNYIINRWAYSPNLLAWEWFNEVDLTPIPDQALLPWLEQMTAYLRQRDVYHHLTTNSFSVRSWSASWHLPELDVVQIHEYANELSQGRRDPVDTVGLEYRYLDQDLPQKPFMLGEFGYSSRERGENKEKTGIQLHNGIWATTFSGYAGSGMYWWWDTYIEPNNLWYHFKGLADFIRGEDLTQYHPDASLQVVDGSTSDAAPVTALGLRGKTTLVWLRGDDYTVDASTEARAGKPSGSAYIPVLKEELYLIIDHVNDGQYTINWFDPQTAGWLSQVTATAAHNRLSLPIPAFRDDLAAKIDQNH